MLIMLDGRLIKTVSFWQGEHIIWAGVDMKTETSHLVKGVLCVWTLVFSRKRKFILKKLDLEDIQLDVMGTVARFVGTTGQHVCLTRLCFENFSEATQIEEVRALVYFFTTSLSTSMLYAVTGKKDYHIGDFSRTFGHYTESALEKVVHHVIR